MCAAAAFFSSLFFPFSFCCSLKEGNRAVFVSPPHTPVSESKETAEFLLQFPISLLRNCASYSAPHNHPTPTPHMHNPHPSSFQQWYPCQLLSLVRGSRSAAAERRGVAGRQARAGWQTQQRSLSLCAVCCPLSAHGVCAHYRATPPPPLATANAKTQGDRWDTVCEWSL